MVLSSFLNILCFVSPQLRVGKRAIRIRRVKEPLLLTLCAATAAAAASADEAEAQDFSGDSDNDSSKSFKGKANSKMELGPNMKLDPELYEGIVSQPIIEPTVSKTPREEHGPSRSVTWG